MAELPVARLVQGTTLRAAPRHIPIGLWLSLALGGVWGQVLWWMLVAIGGSAIAAVATDHNAEGRHLAWMAALLLLALAVPLVAAQAWWAHRQAYLLRHGRETTGRLTHKEVVDVGESTNVHYWFRYQDDGGGEHEVEIKSPADNRDLEDEAAEPMLFDPAGKRSAVPLDHLPGRPRIDPSGGWRPRRSPVLLLIAPGIALAGVVLLALLAR